jgi:tetratricopeptide (TPR) repeat protein
MMGAMEDAIDAGRRALKIAAEIDDGELARMTNFFVATVHHARGEFRAAESCCRASFLPLDGDLTPERARAFSRWASTGRSWLAWSLESLGDFDEALARGREALQIVVAREEPATEAAVSCLLANVHLSLGDSAQAIPLLERALGLCRSHDVSDWLGPVAMRLGFAHSLEGRLTQGLALLEEGDAHCARIGGITGHATRLAGFAQSYLLAGRRADAEATALRGLRTARKHQQHAGEAMCLRALAMVAATDPTGIDAAEEYSMQARDLAASLEMRPLVAHCHADLARLYRSAGKPDQAGQHLATALAMYREMGMDRWIEQARTE